MTQIFIFGSSNAYGVGSIDGGFGDRLKLDIHRLMYSTQGCGEKHELYNFAKPGATVEFVLETFHEQLSRYRNKGKVIAIVSVGGNNIKAEYAPDAYVSSLEEYTALMITLLTRVKEGADDVLALGYRPYDEAKTTPKPNPLTGGHSYFYNERRELFEKALRDVCEKVGTTYIGFDISTADWIDKYQYKDGLHPNDSGYQLIFEEIKKHLVL